MCVIRMLIALHVIASYGAAATLSLLYIQLTATDACRV